MARLVHRCGMGLVVALVAAGTMARLGAQQANPASPHLIVAIPVAEPSTYGTAGNIVLNLGSSDFATIHSEEVSITGTTIYARGVTSTVPISAQLHLPNGAVVHGLDMYYYDTHPVLNGRAELTEISHFGFPITTVFFDAVATAAGNNSQFFMLPTPITINNSARRYVVYFRLFTNGTGSERLDLYKIRVNYRLQVSPAPGTASFADVPVGDPLHRYVEALVGAGITGGCGGGNYCPNAPVTRGQMAVFLAVALGLHWPN